MARLSTNTTLAAAAGRLSAAKRVFITTHAKPDGDAWGSVTALATVLKRMKKRVDAVFMPPVPAAFGGLKGATAAKVLDAKAMAALDGGKYDLVVVLDTAAWNQVAPLRAGLEKNLGKMLVIDHHRTGDMKAAMRHVDATAAATCELVAGVIDRLAKKGSPDRLYTPAVAEALFVGIASDTGWFRFSNTTAATHILAARLKLLGVDHAALYQKLEQMERPAKLALLSRAIGSLRLLAGERAAVMVVRAKDFAETGAHVEETERFVDVPQFVGSVRVVALITELPEGAHHDGRPKVSVSFRSKPGAGAIDVAELAGRFGGGGHARAAGAKIAGPLDEVVRKVEAAVESEF